MKPISLTMENFMGFSKRQTVTFQDGLTVITGANGAGKSSIIDALLFGLHGKTRNGMNNTPNWGDSLGRVEVEYVFMVDDMRYTVVRGIRPRRKATANPQTYASIAVEGPDGSEVERLTSKKAVDERIRSISHNLSFKSFVSTVVALQKEIDILSDSTPGEARSMMRKLTGMDRAEFLDQEARARLAEVKDLYDSYMARAQDLADQRELLNSRLEYTRENRDTIIVLIETEKKELAELERNHAGFEKLMRFHRENQGRHSKIEREIEKIDGEMKAKQSYIDRRVLDVDRGFPKAKEAKTRYDDLIKVKETLLEARSEHAALEERKAYLDRLEREIFELAEEIGRLEGEDHKGQLQERFDRVNALSRELVELEAVRFALDSELSSTETEIKGLLERISEHEEQLDIIRDMAGRHEASCPTCHQGLTDEHLSRVIADYEGLAAGAHRALELKELRLEAIRSEAAETNKRMTAIKCDVESLRLKSREDERLLSRLSELKAGYKRKTSEHTLGMESLQMEETAWDPVRYQVVIDEMEALASGCEEFIRLKQYMEEIPRLIDELSTLQERREELVGNLASLDFDPNEADSINGDMVSCRKRMQTLREKLMDHERVSMTMEAQLHRDNEALECVEGDIEKGEVTVARYRSAFMLASHTADFLKYLSSRVITHVNGVASGFLSAFTDGAYNRLRVYDEFDDEGAERNTNPRFELQVWTGTEYRPVKSFSGGEKTCVNLAVRLALSDVLRSRTNGRLSFIFLDEGLSPLDETRREHVLEAVHGLQRNNGTRHVGFDQLFLITHLEELRESITQRIGVERVGRYESRILQSGTGCGNTSITGCTWGDQTYLKAL